jgi:hypothetical protein
LILIPPKLNNCPWSIAIFSRCYFQLRARNKSVGATRPRKTPRVRNRHSYRANTSAGQDTNWMERTTRTQFWESLSSIPIWIRLRKRRSRCRIMTQNSASPSRV